MRKRTYLIILFLVALLFIFCGKPKVKTDNTQADLSIPVSILVEKEITEVSVNSNFNEPFGLATDLNGNIYIADAGDDRVVKLDSKFKYQTEIGGFGRSAGMFSYPTYLCFDNGLNLYVTDERNRRIAKYDNRLNFVDEILFYDDEDPLKFGYPSGIAVTSYGELWVADRQNNKVMVFNNVGQYTNALGDYGSSAGRMKSPEKIVNSNGKFILCDAGNNRLVILDGYGNFNDDIRLKATEYPISVIDQRNYYIVLDGINGGIHFVNDKGKTIRQVGPQLPGSKIALNEPSDFIMLDDEHLLISDSGNNRLLLCRLLFNNQGE